MLFQKPYFCVNRLYGQSTPGDIGHLKPLRLKAEVFTNGPVVLTVIHARARAQTLAYGETTPTPPQSHTPCSQAKASLTTFQHPGGEQHPGTHRCGLRSLTIGLQEVLESPALLLGYTASRNMAAQPALAHIGEAGAISGLSLSMCVRGSE